MGVGTTSFLLELEDSCPPHTSTCTIAGMATVALLLGPPPPQSPRVWFLKYFLWVPHVSGFNQASEAMWWHSFKAVVGKNLPEGERSILLYYVGCSFRPMIAWHLCLSETIQWACEWAESQSSRWSWEKGPCTVWSSSVLAQGRSPCQKGPNACS